MLGCANRNGGFVYKGVVILPTYPQKEQNCVKKYRIELGSLDPVVEQQISNNDLGVGILGLGHGVSWFID